MYESIKALEIRDSMLFNVGFANYFIIFFSFFNYYLYILISLFTAHIFSSTPEIIVLLEIPTTEAKAEIETHPVTSKAKIICLI